MLKLISRFLIGLVAASTAFAQPATNTVVQVPVVQLCDRAKLMVSRLANTTSDQALVDFFSSVGTVVTAQVTTDRSTGASRGYGYVGMENIAQARSAIAKLNGKSLEGNFLQVTCFDDAKFRALQGRAKRPPPDR